MVTVLETVAPPAGDVMPTVGGAWSLLTVIGIDTEVPTFPNGSYARADSAWLPLEAVLESQAMLKGDVVSEPTSVPSTYSSTRGTPLRSPAVIATATTPATTALAAGEVRLTDGGVVSTPT